MNTQPTTLMRASNEWMRRPADERFTSLPELQRHVTLQRQHSRERVTSNRKLELMPSPDDERSGLQVVGAHDHQPATLSHFSFGQIANLAGAPSGYLRSLAAPLAADCVNYGLRFNRKVEDVGTLVSQPVNMAGGGVDLVTAPQLRAATGPRYGRVWNVDIVDSLVQRFGDGVSGDWRVPGEFGKAVEVSKANTTLYAGDRDMFVFLADETNRIEVANRRDGQSGSLARGFFVWNSEVGSATLGVAFFLFDYVCMNRIVWGVDEYREVRIRHTSGAPDRWLEEVAPVLAAYSDASAEPVVAQIEAARRAKIDTDVDDFLAKRFGKRIGEKLNAQHMAEEGRPVETLWDATTAATAYARSIPWQDDRVALEREAGKVMALASAA